MCFFNYSYAVGVDGTIVVFLSSVRPSVGNSCIVDNNFQFGVE